MDGIFLRRPEPRVKWYWELMSIVETISILEPSSLIAIALACLALSCDANRGARATASCGVDDISDPTGESLYEVGSSGHRRYNRAQPGHLLELAGRYSRPCNGIVCPAIWLGSDTELAGTRHCLRSLDWACLGRRFTSSRPARNSMTPGTSEGYIPRIKLPQMYPRSYPTSGGPTKQTNRLDGLCMNLSSELRAVYTQLHLCARLMLTPRSRPRVNVKTRLLAPG